MPDISTMTDQDIIDYLRKRGSPPSTVGKVRGHSLEEFFEVHNIALQCPACKSANYASFCKLCDSYTY